jgi:pyruvate dehydrogenase E1 component beta subunit
MVIEALAAADELAQIGIKAEVIDLRCLTPIDTETLKASLVKTGHLVVADTSQSAFGVAAEVIAQASKHAFQYLKAAPCCIALPMCLHPLHPHCQIYFIREREKFRGQYIRCCKLRHRYH